MNLNPGQKIPLYWWEGYYGFGNSFSRLVRGKNPYRKNFGDLLSPLIVSLVSGRSIYHTYASGKMLGLGSIFFALSDNDTVWGSGLLNEEHISYARSARNVTYAAVRGPETRELLLKHDIECPEIYGDPALLLPSLIRNDIRKSYRVGIVPHFSHKEYFHSIIKKDARVCMIDVEWPVCNVVKKILACEVILATSLHGLIVAEAYGIPSLMLTVGKPLHGSLFKIEDYFHSTGRALSIYDFQNVTNLATLTELAERQPDVFFDSAPLLAAFPLARADLTSIPVWSEFKPKEDFRKFFVAAAIESSLALVPEEIDTLSFE